MKFELIPILDKMYALYQKAQSMERFYDYLNLLQGKTKGDLDMPISAWNPMAKEHVIEKIAQLQALQAELYVQKLLLEENQQWESIHPDITLEIYLSIADDLKGGWTNRYTSDFDSKFKLNAMVKRNFCVPVFWSSESYNLDLIRERTLTQLYRSIYCFSNPKPKTLENHLSQERFVAKQYNYPKPKTNLQDLACFYQKHKDSEDYNLIFNFFYGDKAPEELGFASYGINSAITGFEYAKI